jgi:hypothetical protein
MSPQPRQQAPGLLTIASQVLCQASGHPIIHISERNKDHRRHTHAR